MTEPTTSVPKPPPESRKWSGISSVLVVIATLIQGVNAGLDLLKNHRIATLKIVVFLVLCAVLFAALRWRKEYPRIVGLSIAVVFLVGTALSLLSWRGAPVQAAAEQVQINKATADKSTPPVTNRTTILVTTFSGPNPQEYGITEAIRDELNDAAARDPELSIVRAEASEVPSSPDEASRLGEKYHADLVVWGFITVPGQMLRCAYTLSSSIRRRG